MADELKIPLDPFTDTGLTLLGKVYNSTGAQEGSTVAMSEDGPALYIGDFDVTTRSDGQYIVRFETNTPDKLYGTGSLYIRDGKEVSPEMYFNQALDTVANVTLVATTTTNTDMRGTDGANTVTPDNAGITANGSAIAALNDYDPAADSVIVGTNNDKAGYSISGTKTTLDALNDISEADVYSEFTAGSNEDAFKADVSGLSTQVSVNTIDSNVDAVKAKTDNLNFTGSDVQSIASNMRGTDGANTTVPDNAGVASNGSAIAALNNISSADVKTQADQALVDYDAPTKIEMDAAFTEIKGAGWSTETLKDIRDNTGPGLDEVALHAGLDNYTNKNDYKTDVSSLATTAQLNSQTTDLKGSSDRDLTEVYDNTPSVDLGDIPTDVTAIKAKTDQLNFTGNDVQSVASNMRGTDGANTVTPDNAGIAANGTNIEELRANQVAANEGIKRSSLIIPYRDDLPNL